MKFLPFAIIFQLSTYIGNVSNEFLSSKREIEKLPVVKQIPFEISEILNRMTDKPDVMEVCKNQGVECMEYVCKMRKHEIFDPCMGNCEKSCLTRYGLKCSPECVPNCICEVGYVRESGECIPVLQCVARFFEYKVIKDKELITYPANNRQYPYYPKMKFGYMNEKHISNETESTNKRQFKTDTFDGLLTAALKKKHEIEKLKYYTN